jgi:hypothetical protein
MVTQFCKGIDMTNENLTSGLLATGKHGSWSVEIHEMTKGVQTLYGIVLRHSMLILQFSIENISVINNLVGFLSGKNSSEYEIDGCLGGTLHWVFDEGRLRIRQITEGRLGESELFVVMLSEGERQDLVEAVKEALKDL